MTVKDYYVYIHRRAHDKAVFYVGKGCGYRAWSNLRSEFWKRTVAKYGYEVEIVISGLQEWAAFEFEQSLIAYYGRRNIKQGLLINLTDGGEGNVGVIRSESSKRKMSELMRELHLDPEIKRKHSAGMRRANAKPEVIARRSEATKRSHSRPEVRQRISENITAARARPEVRASYVEANLGGRNPRARRVRCVDTGEVFDCLRDASRWLHSVGKRGCVTSVVNGKNDTAGGYHWAYADN